MPHPSIALELWDDFGCPVVHYDAVTVTVFAVTLATTVLVSVLSVVIVTTLTCPSTVVVVYEMLVPAVTNV